MSSKYRVITERNLDGDLRYRPQYKIFFCYWRDYIRTACYDGYYIVEFDSLDKAEDFIKDEIDGKESHRKKNSWTQVKEKLYE